MMDYRENAGYVITDSCHVGDSEFVLGVHLTAPQQFVTWKCKDRTDYYWGHYFSSEAVINDSLQTFHPEYWQAREALRVEKARAPHSKTTKHKERER